MAPLSVYQKIIHYRSYARYLPKEHRRETWEETVERYVDFWRNRFQNDKAVLMELEEAKQAILGMRVMPSMRLMYSAGEAVEAENQMAYNCKYQEINSIKSFSDLLYSLMCGCGVGISVERDVVRELPMVPAGLSDAQENPKYTVVIDDSRIGWAQAFEAYLRLLFKGIIPAVDYSKIRRKGARLKTSGGFASGPKPLRDLFKFTLKTILQNIGKPLLPVEVYDICCKIADCVVSGGVRRSAMIALFSSDDPLMLTAKTPDELQRNPWRYNSNNTMVIDSDPVSVEHYEALTNCIRMAQNNGEPGVFFRYNSLRKGLNNEVPGLNPLVS